MKNITCNNVNKFKNNFILKFNEITTVILISKTISMPIIKLLSINIDNRGLNILNADSAKDKLVTCLRACLNLDININNQTFILYIIKIISDINNLHTLKKAYKEFKKKFQNFDNYEINNEQKDLDILITDLLVYICQVIYLEYSKFYHYYLFPNGNPKYTDIKQGNIGDCYLLAGLSSICKSTEGTKAIKKCFINRDTIDIDDYISIRLFKVTLSVINSAISIDSSGKAHIKVGQRSQRVRIDKNGTVEIRILKNSASFSSARGEALWVKFLEQAFDIYRQSNNVSSLIKNNQKINELVKKWNSSKLGDGGQSDIIITAITGKTSYRIILLGEGIKNDKSEYSRNELAIYETIKKKLDKHLAVTAAKPINTNDNSVYANNTDNIDGHMYSVISVGYTTSKNDSIGILLYNPHGKKEVIGLHEFIKNFSIINVESSK